MATATATRPTTPAPAMPTPSATPQPTTREKAVAAVVSGAASVLALGVFAWGAWVASQISIPV